jgi:hypothetical protein
MFFCLDNLNFEVMSGNTKTGFIRKTQRNRNNVCLQYVTMDCVYRTHPSLVNEHKPWGVTLMYIRQQKIAITEGSKLSATEKLECHSK